MSHANKALSIWQPHATLIVLGLKPYETRSWTAWKSLIGHRIWIHAGKALDDLVELGEYLVDRQNGGCVDEAMDAYVRALKSAGFAKLKDLPCGCLIGSALLQASTPTAQLQGDAGPFGNFGPGRFAWRMVDPVPLEVPIPFIGKQGFFDVPDSVARLPDLQDA